jgi:hypothetical protein
MQTMVRDTFDAIFDCRPMSVLPRTVGATRDEEVRRQRRIAGHHGGFSEAERQRLYEGHEDELGGMFQ